MIGIIAQHEGLRLLRSAQTWIIAALLAALFGFLFLKQLESFLAIQEKLATQDHPVGLSGFMSIRYLEPLALVFTVIAPLFAMRSFSDEYRLQTFALWQSSPISTTALVVGKFLGIVAVLLLLVLLAVIMLLTMQFFVNIDIKLILSAALGLSLCAAACAACGVYFSALTRQNLIAIIASLAVLVLSWMLGSANFSNLPLQSLGDLSIANHLRGFFQGYVQVRDVAFFILMISLFLGLSIIKLDSLRQTGN